MLQQTWPVLILILFAEINQSHAFGSDAEDQVKFTEINKKYRVFCKNTPATSHTIGQQNPLQKVNLWETIT